MERSGEVFPASHGHSSLPLRYLIHSCSSLGSADDKTSARVLAQKHLQALFVWKFLDLGWWKSQQAQGQGLYFTLLVKYFTCITWSMTFNFLGPQCPHPKLQLSTLGDISLANLHQSRERDKPPNNRSLHGVC